MKRYNIHAIPAEDPKGEWVQWEDAMAYGTMKVFNEQRDIINRYRTALHIIAQLSNEPSFSRCLDDYGKIARRALEEDV